MNLVVDKYKLVRAIILGTLYIAAFYPFVMQESGLISLFDKVNSPLMLLFDAAAILLGVLTLRKTVDIIMLLTLLVISFVSTCLFNGGSIVFWLNGLRMYLPCIFIIASLRYITADVRCRDDFVRRMDKFLYIFLWAQAPVITFQYLRYGAGDFVGGTIGHMGSGMMSSMIFMTSFYLMQRRWDPSLSYLRNITKNWVLIFLLFPTGLNETKISLIYIMLYFIFLLKVDKKFIIRFLLILPVAVAVFFVSLYAYIQVTGNEQYLDLEYMEYYARGDDELYDMMEDFVDYSDDYEFIEAPDFPRGAKFVMIPMFLNNEPYAETWGYGVGLVKGGTSLEKSNFSKSYDWFMEGTIMQGMIWWLELGWLGLLWGLFYLLVLFGVIGPRPLSLNNSIVAFLVIFTAIQVAYSPIMSKIVFVYIFSYIAFFAVHWSSLPKSKL